jgi:hypothetical protein
MSSDVANKRRFFIIIDIVAAGMAITSIGRSRLAVGGCGGDNVEGLQILMVVSVVLVWRATF